MRGLALLLLIAPLVACPSTPPDTLVVELRTDYVPGVDFARLSLREAGATVAGRALARDEVGADWTSAARVLSEPVAGGEHAYVFTLEAADGEMVAERPFRVEVRGRTGVVLLLARSCEDVSCPAPGGAPGANACLAGSCVPDDCLDGSESTCGGYVPECTSDSECGTSPCAPIACEAPGFCFPESFDCPVGEYCDLSRGCLPVPDPDVDAGFDAGVDADTMTIDAGTDAGEDGGVDASVDGGVDAGMDAGLDIPDQVLSVKVAGVGGADLQVAAIDTGVCIFLPTRASLILEDGARELSRHIGEEPGVVADFACLEYSTGAPMEFAHSRDTNGVENTPSLSCRPNGDCAWVSPAPTRMSAWGAFTGATVNTGTIDASSPHTVVAHAGDVFVADVVAT